MFFVRSAFVMLARPYPWGWCLRLEMSGRVNALHLESVVERLHCSTSIGWNWFLFSLGQEEFRYTKPHPDATFLVCDERSVSGLFDVNFGHAIFMFLMIPSCDALHIRVLRLGYRRHCLSLNYQKRFHAALLLFFVFVSFPWHRWRWQDHDFGTEHCSYLRLQP